MMSSADVAEDCLFVLSFLKQTSWMTPIPMVRFGYFCLVFVSDLNKNTVIWIARGNTCKLFSFYPKELLFWRLYIQDWHIWWEKMLMTTGI